MADIIPVVFCFDKRIILGASVAIKSLIDCAKEATTYDIRIFHSDLSLENQRNINKLVDCTRHSVAFHYINPEIFKGLPKSKGSWTEIVYYRLIIPEILKEYDKAIYSDVDVLFKDDLSELYNTDISDYQFGAVRAEKNTPNTVGHKYFEENKNDFIYWSGLMLLNCKKFREEKLFEKLIENAKRLYKELRFFDLDLLNITCDKIYPVDMKYCVMQSIYYHEDYDKRADYRYLKGIYSDEEIETSKENTVIVHYGGKPGKPWRLVNPYGDYKTYICKLPKNLRVYTFRDIRKRFFSKDNLSISRVIKRIQKVLLGLYKDLHKYFILLPPGLNPLTDEANAWYSEERVIMHGFGRYNSQTYTNSKEALMKHIALGNKIYECDVTLTNDGIPVLSHDDINCDSESFKKRKKSYTRLTLAELVEIAKQNENLYFILDIKDGLYKKICLYLKEIADESVLKHFIIQAGTKKHFKIIKSIYDFKIHWNFSVDGNLNRLLCFCIKNGIHSCSVADKNIKNEKTLKYINKYNLKAYAYCVNDTARAHQLIKYGCNGIMTDDLVTLEANIV